MRHKQTNAICLVTLPQGSAYSKIKSDETHIDIDKKKKVSNNLSTPLFVFSRFLFV